MNLRNKLAIQVSIARYLPASSDCCHVVAANCQGLGATRVFARWKRKRSRSIVYLSRELETRESSLDGSDV